MAATDELPSTAGHYGLRTIAEPLFPNLDVVFVHGLSGNRETTWIHKRTKTFWPLDLLPKDLPNARILTFGYDADIAHTIDATSSNSLRDHGKSLANGLAINKMRARASNRPTLFVAHSLGGLVCEQALLICRNSAERHMNTLLDAVKGIAFLGTPHAGSNLAKWGRVLTGISSIFMKTNQDILRVLNPGSEMLAAVQQDFHTMLDSRREIGEKMMIFCFYEECGVNGIGEIVPKHSAILSGYDNQCIHSNHMGMARFTGFDDGGYIMVSGQLWLWARKLEEQSLRRRTVGQIEEDQNRKTVVYSGTVHAMGSGSIFQGDRNIGALNLGR